MRRQWLKPGTLRSWREAIGFTQKQVLTEFNNLLQPDEVSLATYQKWERGQVQPYPRHFVVLRQMIHEGSKEQTYPDVVEQLKIFKRLMGTNGVFDIQPVAQQLKEKRPDIVILVVSSMEPPLGSEPWTQIDTQDTITIWDTIPLKVYPTSEHHTKASMMLCWIVARKHTKSQLRLQYWPLTPH